jgi:hypothetical protein
MFPTDADDSEAAEMGSAIDFAAARGPGSHTEWGGKRDVLECRVGIPLLRYRRGTVNGTFILDLHSYIDKRKLRL